MIVPQYVLDALAKKSRLLKEIEELDKVIFGWYESQMTTQKFIDENDCNKANTEEY